MIFVKTKCFQSICQNMKPDDSVEVLWSFRFVAYCA